MILLKFTDAKMKKKFLTNKTFGKLKDILNLEISLT